MSMGNKFGHIGVAVGLALLLHSGYSVSQHLAFVRYNEEESTALALDLILEGLIGLALAVWGCLWSREFKEIRAVEDIATKSSESFLYRPNFLVLSHRGKKLYG